MKEGSRHMYKEVYFQDFINAFKEAGRENQFSYEGKKALFDYLEEYERECQDRMELDIIAICCDYTEYANLEALQEDYSVYSMEELEDNTTVINIDETAFIVLNY
jgi:hypothetical protein